MTDRPRGPGEPHLRRDMRRHVRRAVEVPVFVTDAEKRIRAQMRFTVANLSQGGAFLRSDLLFEVGEVLELELELSGGRRIRARGKVVRVSRGSARGAPAGMGIEFLGLEAADRAALESILR